jgi:hypothetical protein
VVQAAVDAQGELAVSVDLVVADTVVAVGAALAARGGFRAGGVGGGGVAECCSERCGRRVLYSSTKSSIKACSSARVRGWTGWASSHFFRVC